MARTPAYQPIPPREMPPARTVLVPDRGEFFVRDTGGTGPVALLLHGWMVSADLNWHSAYGPLAEAGYRVLPSTTVAMRAGCAPCSAASCSTSAPPGGCRS